MKKRRLAIGMLGCGWMGKAHTNAFHTLKYMNWENRTYDTVLEAVCARDMRKSQDAADRYGFNQAFYDWNKLISTPGLDIFDNVAPDGLHVQPCIEAANKGLHLICEKPLAVGRNDAKKMLEAAETNGVKHLCCFSYRFFPAVRLAYELIKSGELGKIYHFTGKYYQDQGSDETTKAEDIWYINFSGIGQGIASHLIDMSRFLIGEIASVTGMVTTYNKVRQSKNGIINTNADEGFFAMAEFINGATGVFESLGVANGKQSEFSWQIFGSRGSLMWDVSEPNYLKVYFSQSKQHEIAGFTNVCCTEMNHPLMNIWWPRGHNLGWEHGHINMIDHFLTCIADDCPVSPLAATFEDGYKVAVIIDTINESVKQGARLNVQY